ncbi:MAG: relaxase domain-containing protein [bacterium]
MHDNAVCKTIQYVELNIIPGKIKYAAFRHHCSHQNNPHLHTHIILANRVFVTSKEYPINVYNIFNEQTGIGEMYRLDVINQLRELSIGIKITDYKNCFYEIEGINQETIEHFSDNY